MNPGPLLVTFDLDPKGRVAVREGLAGAADALFLPDVPAQQREGALRSAAVVLARNIGKELRPEEMPLIGNARLLQFRSAGVDYIPLKDLPRSLPVAFNGGAFAEPMAEHAVAMALAAAKRLMVEHRKLAEGEFNQFTTNKTLAGGTCGVLGFGGIGVATARLMRALGMRIHAVNRRGASGEATDWIGTPDQLDELLAASDVLVISAPLTRRTVGLIGARELGLLPEDCILVNLARGEIIDETALYEHLVSHPRFTACIDAWWVEPIRHGRFETSKPFLDLPNVIGSPHNSASVRGAGQIGLQRAVANCRRALLGQTPLYLIGEEERML